MHDVLELSMPPHPQHTLPLWRLMQVTTRPYSIQLHCSSHPDYGFLSTDNTPQFANNLSNGEWYILPAQSWPASKSNLFWRLSHLKIHLYSIWIPLVPVSCMIVFWCATACTLYNFHSICCLCSFSSVGHHPSSLQFPASFHPLLFLHLWGIGCSS